MRPLTLSVLDLAPIGAGFSSSQALKNSTELAQHVERLGYVRVWYAEHHGMASIASSSPEVLIAHVAAATERIRVGSGGIMLPNHAALRIAEAFHTLEALHPGRIDLGLGRAPGSNRAAMMAMRPFDSAQYPAQIAELRGLSRGDYPPNHPFHGVHAAPGDVRLPPLWLLGSSGGSAELAGSLGAGYAFASHFSPTPPGPAVQLYRDTFVPSEQFPEPRVILGVSVLCAETEEKAEWLASTLDLFWVRFTRNDLRPLPFPEEALAYPWSPVERAIAQENRARHIIGTPDSVWPRLRALAEEAGAGELMVSTLIPGQQDRLKSYELLATRTPWAKPA